MKNEQCGFASEAKETRRRFGSFASLRMTVPSLRMTFAFAVLLGGCKDDSVDAHGNFEATEVTVAAEVGGRLLSFGLEEGDRVAPDSVVGVVDTVPLLLERRALLARRAAAAARASRPSRRSSRPPSTSTPRTGSAAPG